MCCHRPRVTAVPCSDAQGLALAGWALFKPCTDRRTDGSGCPRASHPPARRHRRCTGSRGTGQPMPGWTRTARGSAGTRTPLSQSNALFWGCFSSQCSGKVHNTTQTQNCVATFEHTRSPGNLSWPLHAHQRHVPPPLRTSAAPAPPPTPRRTCWEGAEFYIVWSP